MENIIFRIKKWRKERGYSYETMGHELNISPAAYRKIEINETKLTVERLFQIVKVLDVNLEDILSLKNHQIIDKQQIEKDDPLNNYAYFNLDNKEKMAKIESLYEERIKEQALTINQLIEVINNKNSI